MTTLSRFEDLIAWQKARTLTNALYRATKGTDFSKDFALRDQLRRAAISIMANIAEGFERHRHTEFHQFLSIAKASCAEVRSHLYLARDMEYVSADEFSALQRDAEEVGRILGGLQSSLRKPSSSPPAK